jgi:hypothetical protein
MANLGNITLPLEALNGGINKYLLGDKVPAYNYESNKRTSDTPVGIKLTLSLPGNKLMQVTVRIEGADPLPQLTNEAIHNANTSGDFIYVELIGSSAKLYTIDGEQRISASAKGVSLLEYIEFGEEMKPTGKK